MIQTHPQGSGEPLKAIKQERSRCRPASRKSTPSSVWRMTTGEVEVGVRRRGAAGAEKKGPSPVLFGRWRLLVGGWPQAGQWVTVAPGRGAGLLRDDHTLCSIADPVSPDWWYPRRHLGGSTF